MSKGMDRTKDAKPEPAPAWRSRPPPTSWCSGTSRHAPQDTRLPEYHSLGHREVKTLRQFARTLVPDR